MMITDRCLLDAVGYTDALFTMPPTLGYVLNCLPQAVISLRYQMLRVCGFGIDCWASQLVANGLYRKQSTG